MANAMNIMVKCAERVVEHPSRLTHQPVSEAVMPALDPSKVCFACNEEKPLTEFYRHQAMSDGHLGKCKECTKAAVRANRAAKLDYYQEYDRRRSQENPERIVAQAIHRKITANRTTAEKSREITRRYRAKKQHAYVATSRLNTAVGLKKITKPESCEICNSKDRVEGHHHDYSKPLDVWWLCDHCHKHIHRMIRSAERKRKKEGVYCETLEAKA